MLFLVTIEYLMKLMYVHFSLALLEMPGKSEFTVSNKCPLDFASYITLSFPECKIISTGPFSEIFSCAACSST